MQLFILALFWCIVTAGSLPIYKKDLRIVHKLEKNKIIAHMIIDDFNRIYQEINHAAKLGKTECRFELRCSYTLGIDFECRENRHNELLYQMDHIQFEMPYKSYSQILIKKINQTFPDSTLVQIKKPCCSYILTW
jgi:hypothetical protein